MPRVTEKGNRTWPNIQVRPFPNRKTAAISLNTGFASTSVKFNLTENDGWALLQLLDEWLSPRPTDVRLAVKPEELDAKVLEFLGHRSGPRTPELSHEVLPLSPQFHGSILQHPRVTC